MLQLQRPDTLVERVVNAIRKEIDAGRLTAESRLPTEQQLTEQLNVSRSVVREAVAQLKADGILVSRRGLGSFISQNPNGSVFRFPSQKGRKPDLVQMFEMRLWIETQAASIAAQRRDDADLQRMRTALQEMHDQRSDLAAAALADVEFHRAIADASKNHYFVAFHDFLRGQLAEARRTAWENSAAHSVGGSADAGREHQALYEAIAAGDRLQAAACAEAHLRAAAKRLKIDLPSID
ncbi:FadR/GntR family transcriptional regulator [Pseudomonas chlororaphis]|uniref:Transcriptional regulator, GntR family n=1 Tax=Pseudomonas chlororaphis TaxID=587753 RepID=A0AAX3FMX4_9PSED|nr:FadR/GntR family transcriptional regulator [Pseudomonas chlororaphis]AZC37283.1 putative D-glucarate or D-galactorate regulator, GntR family [Pseudomonas chlororaphis subsp. piscium]AZC43831.1 putative D-glucarate or D-galactorate regulator, GntR family [Pseudomonas chlororaphis subsp. piscium]AZC50475.1 putative D-glucarate or D-galactorate regulator, GntR family [Pseudomonas chlororaphis subsp. piscium]AZD54608.1 putative D-glucarate or D-galactorate regulator, GntR family [Pseudomonas chl